MLKLKLEYFGHLMQRADSLEKTLMLEGLGAGGEGDDRGWDDWMASPTRWTWVWVNSGSWWWTGRPGVLQFMGRQSRTRLSDWTELNWTELKIRVGRDCFPPDVSRRQSLCLSFPAFRNPFIPWLMPPILAIASQELYCRGHVSFPDSLSCFSYNVTLVTLCPPE